MLIIAYVGPEFDGGVSVRASDPSAVFFLVCRRFRFSSARCFFSISRRRFSNVF